MKKILISMMLVMTGLTVGGANCSDKKTGEAVVVEQPKAEEPAKVEVAPAPVPAEAAPAPVVPAPTPAPAPVK